MNVVGDEGDTKSTKCYKVIISVLVIYSKYEPCIDSSTWLRRNKESLQVYIVVTTTSTIKNASGSKPVKVLMTLFMADSSATIYKNIVISLLPVLLLARLIEDQLIQRCRIWVVLLTSMRSGTILQQFQTSPWPIRSKEIH